MTASLEEFLDNEDPAAAEGLDFLLETADLVRSVLSEKRFEDLCLIIAHEVKHGFYEALSWSMDLIQEAYEKDEGMPPFTCSLGGSLPGFDLFEKTLRVRPDAVKNEIRKITDGNGEVKEFFNICVYPTQYQAVFLVSSENFDTRDNDYIRYSLVCTNETVQ